MQRNKPQRNNNPVNLRYRAQKESTGADSSGFAIFLTPESGWRAAHRQIKLDQKRDLTLREFIFKFAPPNENNTNDYLKFVAKELHISVDTPIAEISVFALAGIMAGMEGYYA